MIFTSPQLGKSVGVINAISLSTFLYFALSRNFPSIMPEFLVAGSKIDIESSARKNETINLRSISSGTRVLNLAVKRSTVLSLSTYLKKSLFGFSGRSLKTYPRESISSPNPL